MKNSNPAPSPSAISATSAVHPSFFNRGERGGEEKWIHSRMNPVIHSERQAETVAPDTAFSSNSWTRLGQIANIERPTSNVQHRKKESNWFNVGCSVFSVGRSPSKIPAFQFPPSANSATLAVHPLFYGRERGGVPTFHQSQHGCK